jgi:N-acetylmuramoyl-L-alanine amidase
MPVAAKQADRSLTRALGLKLGRVVLDAGHGGNDVGTHGPSGYLEKDLTLDVAQRLGALIEQRMGSEVVYTRSDDSYVGLEERTRIANQREADLFLSIHANSSPYRATAGVETYVLNFTTSKSALELAARENATSDRSIHDLHDLLEKIALKDKIDESREFASKLQTSLSVVSKSGTQGAKNRGVKTAPFVVLIGAAMPSVLAEIGFLTNATEEALLRKPEHRQKIAEALYKGITAYADTLSRIDVARK